MMDILLVSAAALVTAGLTFFSGFGLGTLLLPVFAIFFPVEIAVAATAIVHFANNLFKVILVGRQADKEVTLKFAIPAAAAAFVGAWLLAVFTDLPAIFSYSIGDKEFFIYPIKLTIGILMIVFAILELNPSLITLKMNRRFVPVGGVLSGFFGGLSGHQGALRTAFLLKAGLSKEALIGTMVVSGFVVDFVRIIVYGSSFFFKDISSLEYSGIVPLLIAGCLAAFVGSYFGKYIFDKVTFGSVKLVIAAALLLFGFAFGLGII
jgi:uncharacterized protein